MGIVFTALSMSVDGFIAGPADDVGRIFGWYNSGDTDYQMPGNDMMVKVSRRSAERLHDMHQTTGALVTGRRTFDITNGWDGRHPMGVPTFVVTHTIPRQWAGEDSPFTFVTAGVESAVHLAKAVAGAQNVGVGAASIVQQCLQAGLLDEIQIELVPVLLGEGTRLFDHLGIEPIDLEPPTLIETPAVTHLRFRVVK